MSHKKWDDVEETQLLEEIKNNINIELIAKKHNRTIGAIKSRVDKIALTLYKKNYDIESICNITKLQKDSLNNIIGKNIKFIGDISYDSHNFNLENEITYLKKELLSIKKSLALMFYIIKNKNNDVNL